MPEMLEGVSYFIFVIFRKSELNLQTISWQTQQFPKLHQKIYLTFDNYSSEGFP